MQINKKFAAGIATGALLLSISTPAVFAGYDHSDQNSYESKNYSASNHGGYGYHSHKLFTQLHGEEEVPGPGDPNGYGITKVKVDHDNGKVCVNIRVLNIAPATKAHIHEGEEGVAGPVVVTLPTPNEHGRASGCVSVSSELAEDIADNPSDYYVNIHNSEYPDGAVRGQL